MKLGCALSLALLSMSFFAGCEKASAPAGGTTSASHAQFTPTEAQPKLPTLKVWLGAHEITAELAVKPKEVMTGMMFRKSIEENEGMLFIFARPQRAAFWMKNVSVPLSCAYIDSEGTILEVHDMKPFDENTIQAGTDQVQYVLEMKQGWFDRHNVGKGTLVRTEKGSLAETFFRRR
jgi:hypothetical protein